MGAGEAVSLLQQWYTSSMSVVCTWLTDRMDLQLHIYQLKTLIRIVKVSTQDVPSAPHCLEEPLCAPACVWHMLCHWQINDGFINIVLKN